MDVTIEKEHEKKLEFTVSGITPLFANAIRRYGMSRVPVLAVDKVTFYDNTSSLFDEYLAHRIGLMPVKTPSKLNDDFQITFSLDQSGPKVVCSGDFKSSDSDIVFVKENIPLITLEDGQHLMLEGKAVIGIGRKHAKFQCALVSYSIEKEKFKFMVDGLYNMPIKDVVLRACEQLKKDLDEFSKLLKKKVK